MENKKMKRISSLAILASAALTLAAAPAFAAPSVQKGKSTCTAEAQKQTPAPKWVRIDDTKTHATSDAFVFTLRTKNADNSDATMVCTFNFDTGAAAITPAH
jgi:hypothetical protein